MEIDYGKAPKWGSAPIYEKTSKGISQGRNPITSTMNKNKRKSYKKYRGQGKTKIMPGVVRVSLDSHVGHASPTPNPFHRTSYASGSPNVFTNSAKTVRIGDKTSCVILLLLVHQMYL